MKENRFCVRRSTDGGESFEAISSHYSPLCAILAMRRMVRETVSQLIDNNEDFSLCQTNDSRWPDAWGYTNNGYTITCDHEKEKIIFEVVDAKDM